MLKQAQSVQVNKTSLLTNNLFLTMAYAIMAEARVRKDAFKEWRSLIKSGKTCPNFKTRFFQAHQDQKQESNTNNSDSTDENEHAKFVRKKVAELQNVLHVNLNTVEETTISVMRNFKLTKQIASCDLNYGHVIRTTSASNIVKSSINYRSKQ